MATKRTIMHPSGYVITFDVAGQTYMHPSGYVVEGNIQSLFDGQRQNILNNIDSAQSEGTGWDALFKAIPVSNVVRTSDTRVTITIPALPTYGITAQETITVTVPNEALTISGLDVTGAPTFTVDLSGHSRYLHRMSGGIQQLTGGMQL